MLTYVLLIAGFALLIKGAGLLVDGASSIARRLKVSDLLIGLTVVAFGTSTPELFVNLMASVEGTAAIAIGNILGSNIFNILLILGLSSIIFPLVVTRGTVWKEIPLTLLAAALLGVMAFKPLIIKGSSSGISRIEGLILLAFFGLFMYYVLKMAGRAGEGHGEPTATGQYTLLRSSVFVLAGFAALFLGAKLVVDAAVNLAQRFGVSESFIGLTIVAAGTSLPELATSVVAAAKKNCDIAVGNIVGSNIFNIFLILGFSAVIRPMPFQPGNSIDIGVAVLASLLLFVFMFSGKKGSLDRWEGAVLLAVYIGYIMFLVVRG
jgi:cation:H+ antiporter